MSRRFRHTLRHKLICTTIGGSVFAFAPLAGCSSIFNALLGREVPAGIGGNAGSNTGGDTGGGGFQLERVPPNDVFLEGFDEGETILGRGPVSVLP